MPYQGVATFLGSPMREKALARPFGFIGLPYDCATTFRPGARLGPNAIRQASMMLTDGTHPTLGVDPCQFVTDLGDAMIPYVSQKDALSCIEGMVDAALELDHLPVVAGGDHLVTLGVLRSLHRQKGRMAMIHFDAHCDTWPDHFGDTVGHGTWLRNACDEGLVDPAKTIQIGLRSPVDHLTRRWLETQGGRVISARLAMRHTPKSIVEVIRDVVGGGSVYLSFDIDALDPAFAPGTGTPEVGGLTTMWVLEVIELLAGLHFVAMDVVEVAPAYDSAGITALAAATLLWTFIGLRVP